MHELDAAELAAVLGQARSLAREALAALHFAQRRQAVHEAVVREAVLEASDAAAEKVAASFRLREEWRRREHWVRCAAHLSDSAFKSNAGTEFYVAQ